MDSHVVPVRGLTAGDEDAWRELAVRAAEPNPFYEPDCVVPAARHQPGGDAIMLAVAESGGRWYGCLPFRLVHRWKFPYPIATSQVRRMGYLGTPLVDPSAGVEATTALLAGVASQRRLREARIFVLDTSHADGLVSEFLRVAASNLGFPLYIVDSWERGLLVRRPGGDYFNAFTGKFRYNIRRRSARLEELVGGVVRVVDRSDEPGAVDDYIAMEASGYKSRTGVAMTTVPGEPQYFAEMCGRFRDAGRLRVLALQGSNHRNMAMEVWIKGGDGLFLPKISYDETYASFGPGILLQTAAFDHFHASGAEWLDTCTSRGNQALLRLYPERRNIEVLAVVLSRNPLDSFVIKAFVRSRPLHHRLYMVRHPDHVTVGSGHT